MVEISPWAWAGFLGIVGVMLAIDLGVFHRRPHEIKLREASIWAAIWISTGIAFAGVVWWLYDQAGGRAEAEHAVQLYVTGFILEKSLSVDNLFVFIILFRYFDIDGKHQHDVLFWGILGALMMRGAFIFAGVAALHAWAPSIYILALLLIYTSIKMAVSGESTLDPGASRIYQFLQRHFRFTSAEHNGHFFTREGGKRVATTLFLCLIMVETTDVLFALDSVPAVLGVTTDPFIVYTSNIFAILGLRSLFFVVSAGMKTLHYLKPALVFLLLFIGVKMVLGGPSYPILEIPIWLSLVIILCVLGVALVTSLAYNRRHPAEARAEAEHAATPVTHYHEASKAGEAHDRVAEPSAKD